MISYSLGFITYYFICYLICGSILKRYDLALLILLLNILFVSDTFFWPPSQLPAGIALLILTLAFASNKEQSINRPLTFMIIVPALITAAFFHPLVVFVMLYCILFFVQRQGALIGKRLLYITGLIFFSGIILKTVVFRTAYEQHSMSGLKNFVTLFPDYFNLFSNERFVHDCITKYYWIPILAVSVAISYGRDRAWLKLVTFSSFLTGYLFLVNISYPTAVTAAFYMENLYLPMSIFVGLPLIFDVLPVLEKKKLAIPLMTAIILSGCIRIYATHGTYSNRLGYERRQLDKYAGRKVIVKAEKTDIDTLQMLWSNPYEFAILSSCERGAVASIIVDEHPQERGWAAGQKNSLVVNWNFYKYSELPKQYFHFTDTVNGYAILNVKP
jgi:hypothetical protein